MAESNNSKNPCEKCIVKPICTISCDELINFSRKILSSRNLMPTWNTWHNYWIENYECRPRIKELNKDLYPL